MRKSPTKQTISDQTRSMRNCQLMLSTLFDSPGKQEKATNLRKMLFNAQTTRNDTVNTLKKSGAIESFNQGRSTIYRLTTVGEELLAIYNKRLRLGEEILERIKRLKN